MDYEPQISVIITTYNCAAFVENTIESAVNQTYRNKEIIIVDDGSDDSTRTQIEKLADKYKEFQCYFLEHTGSPAKVRNYGISKSKGNYIAFLDGDDVWVKNKLSIQVKKLAQNPGCVLAYSMSVTFGDVNYFSPYYEVLPLLHRAARTRDELVKGNVITNSSVLVKADVLKESGWFDEDPLLKVEDYELWLRLGEKGNYLFIPRILVRYRIHGNQFSGNWTKKQENLQYLAKKKNIPIPPYSFYRNKNIFIRIIRNSLHVLNNIVASVLSASDKVWRGGTS